MNRRVELTRGEVNLSIEIVGRDAHQPILFLHGLAGYGGEWNSVAAQLTESYRCLLLDLRAHGRSTRRPPDTTPTAHVEDARHVAHALGEPGGSLVVVGQSFGGVIGFLLAARHPALVQKLVVVEASPTGPQPQLPERIQRWLRKWPHPFKSPTEIETFFGAAEAEAWQNGLQLDADGYRPRFDSDMLVETIQHIARQAWWDDWANVHCPTLVIRGERGSLDEDTAEQMAASAAAVEVATVPRAGHNIHLEAPGPVADLVARFINR